LVYSFVAEWSSNKSTWGIHSFGMTHSPVGWSDILLRQFKVTMVTIMWLRNWRKIYFSLWINLTLYYSSIHQVTDYKHRKSIFLAHLFCFFFLFLIHLIFFSSSSNSFDFLYSTFLVILVQCVSFGFVRFLINFFIALYEQKKSFLFCLSKK